MFVEFTALGLNFAAFISVDQHDEVTVHRMHVESNDAMFLLQSFAEPEISYAINKAVDNRFQR